VSPIPLNLNFTLPRWVPKIDWQCSCPDFEKNRAREYVVDVPSLEDFPIEELEALVKEQVPLLLMTADCSDCGSSCQFYLAVPGIQAIIDARKGESK